ncbi:Uncharacterised protein [Turicibacter sanguinis]|nr:Uncharacterised protein [Turicibacter sanguinis]
MYEIGKFKITQNDIEVEEISIGKNNRGNFKLNFILPTKSILNSKLIVILVSVAEDRILILHDEIYENDFDGKEYASFILSMNNTLFLGEGLYNLIACSVPLEAFEVEQGISVKEIIDSYSEIFRVVRAVKNEI